MNNQIATLKKGNIDVVDSRLLHKELQVRTQHSEWMRRRIDIYQFEEGKDFWKLDNPNMDSLGTHGGIRRWKTYLITLDMAKELSMLENSDIGKQVRRYFIRRDKALRKIEATRLAGIQVRKKLTDEIQESGENERMHGHGYSTYTKLAYKLTGIEVGSRDALSADDLERLETEEGIMRGLIKAGQEYKAIKEALQPLFTA